MISYKDKKTLNKILTVDGLMEYVAVPWSNHRSGDPDTYENLTVNLAIWFIHILAGNHHEVSWDYDALTSEITATEPSIPVIASGMPQVKPGPGGSGESQQELDSQGVGSFSQKRRKRRVDEDAIHYSFTESKMFATQAFVSQLRSMRKASKFETSQQALQQNRAHGATPVVPQRGRETWQVRVRSLNEGWMCRPTTGEGLPKDSDGGGSSERRMRSML